MRCQTVNVLKATFSAVAVVLILAPSPALLAPSAHREHKRQTQSTLSNTSVEAFSGLLVTLIFTEGRPGFSNSRDNREHSDLANSMCDLLAYRDTLASPPSQEPDDTNSTASTDNTTENLLALLELNVKDTCAWLRVAIQEADGSTADSIELQSGPTSCDLDHLRLFCVTRRLAAIEHSVLMAVQTSIYDTYNGGSPTSIPRRSCDWIDKKVPSDVPQLRSDLDCIFSC